MELLELSLETPAEQLACDQVLLELCDETGSNETLRFWESGTTFVVLGYGNEASVEVDLDASRAHGIAVMRRCSGGGAIVQGPGCLNYALVLQTTADGPLSTITGTTAYVMQRHAAAIQPLVPGTIAVSGHSDLTIDGMKFSGNAQRRALRSVLVHGTYLIDFDISFVETLLRMPSRQPAYRRSRRHDQFMVNLPLSRDAIRSALTAAWSASVSMQAVSVDRIRAVARDRYMSESWIYRR